jgi:hypothetical protein
VISAIISVVMLVTLLVAAAIGGQLYREDGEIAR